MDGTGERVVRRSVALVLSGAPDPLSSQFATVSFDVDGNGAPYVGTSTSGSGGDAMTRLRPRYERQPPVFLELRRHGGLTMLLYDMEGFNGTAADVTNGVGRCIGRLGPNAQDTGILAFQVQ